MTTPNEYLSINDLMRLLRTCRSTIDNMRKKGSLPEPIYVGRCPRWLRSEIDAHFASTRGKK